MKINWQNMKKGALVLALSTSTFLLSCTDARKKEAEDSSKVSDSTQIDPAHRDEVDRGVGQDGKGYAGSGNGEVVTGTDTVPGTSGSNAPPATNDTTKK